MITSSFLISFRLKQQVMVQTVDTLEQGISRKKYEKCQSCKGLRCWGCSFPFQPELSLPEKTRDLTRKVKETYSWGFSINLEDCVVNLNNFQLRNKKQFLCLEMQAFCFLFIFYFFFLFSLFFLVSVVYGTTVADIQSSFEIMERKPCRYSDRNGNYYNTRA